MSRFGTRRNIRRNSRQKNITCRDLKMENLEPRQMLTTAFSLPDASNTSTDLLNHIGPGEMGPALFRYSDGNSQGSQAGRPDARPDTGDRAGPWYAKLSPTVRHSIERGQDLTQFSRRDLQNASSWAVVTKDRATARDLFRKIRPKSVQDRTDLFGDQIRVHVWEVELNRRSDYRGLLKLAQDGKDPRNTGGPILDIIPLFPDHYEPNGTLNPAAVIDPNFPAQWHLDATANNTQWGIDAEAAWGTATGENVTIAIVDTRQHTGHPDLAGSFNAGISFDSGNIDWNGDGIGDNNPNITLAAGSNMWPNIVDFDCVAPLDGIPDDCVRFQAHGTAVAGIALGDNEGTGIVGVAPDANYAAFNFLEPDQGTGVLPANGPFQAQSIVNTFSAANITPIDVFNNSWGFNNTRLLRFSTFLDLQAVQNAATRSILVKSAGNNRDASGTFNGWDRTNLDQMHMRQAIMVAAAQQNGSVEFYSNPGSNNLISAPVNRTGNGNTWTSDVTDVFNNGADNRGYVDGNITTAFNGTSAAAPMVTGVIALMLEANPNLDWRNAQHILIDTAQKNGLIDQNGDGIFDGGDGDSNGAIDNFNIRNTFLGTVNYDTDVDGFADPYHTGWFQNAAGNWVSDDFGFGMVDARAAVQAAVAWSLVPPELSVDSFTKTITTGVIAEGNLGGLNSVNNIDTFITESNLTVEWVEVTINATVGDPDDLMLVLRSPSGTQSVLMAPGGTSVQQNINNFTFNTNQFWDENASGTWTLQALDTGVADGQATTINDWQISIYGTCDVVSPLQVTSLANPFASLNNFASLALSAGGLGPASYVINNVSQVGDSSSMGVFSNGAASGLPLDQGLLFTSGKLVDAIGPNDKPDTSTNWSDPGHPLLNDLTGQTTFDASGLEIYFTPTENVTISYDFLFGSEEFDEWVGSIFNDGAGIFITALKSPNDDYQNGFTPVNIAQTFNGADLAINELATNSQNGGVFGKYYDPNPCCGDMNWEYDGSSLLSHSNSIPLKAGANYYIGMMVADSSDEIYDSALAIGLDGSGAKAGDLFNIVTKPFPLPTEPKPLPIEFRPADFARRQPPPFKPQPTPKDKDLPRRQRENQIERISPATVQPRTAEADAWDWRDLENTNRRESQYQEQVDALFEDFDPREVSLTR